MNEIKATPPRGGTQRSFSQARADAITAQASSVIAGIDALSDLCGAAVADAVDGVTVQWFTARLRGQTLKILDLTGAEEPEPERA